MENICCPDQRCFIFIALNLVVRFICGDCSCCYDKLLAVKQNLKLKIARNYQIMRCLPSNLPIAVPIMVTTADELIARRQRSALLWSALMSKLDLKLTTETGMGGIGGVLQKAEESAIILWCSELHNKLLPLVLLFPLSSRLQGKEGKRKRIREQEGKHFIEEEEQQRR